MPLSIPLQKSSQQTWFIGHTYSYRLNAITNSYIARGVMQKLYGHKIQEHEYSQEVQWRVAAFSDLSQQVDDQKNLLLGVVFAQYYINGGGNTIYPPGFLFSRQIKNMFAEYLAPIAYHPKLGAQILQPFPYRGAAVLHALAKIIAVEKTESLEDILSHAVRVQRPENKIHKTADPLYHSLWNRYSIHTHNGMLSVSPKQAFITGVMLVEHLNPVHNVFVAKKISEGDLAVEKAYHLFEAATLFSHPWSFIKGAVASQEIAATSDIAGVSFFTPFWPRIMKNVHVLNYIEESKAVYKQRIEKTNR